MESFDIQVLAKLFNRNDLWFHRSDCLLWRHFRRGLDVLICAFQEMFRLAVEVGFGLGLQASVALDPTGEVVILTLRADPPTVGKLEVAVSLRFVLVLLLVLGPLGSALVDGLFRGDRRFLFFGGSHRCTYLLDLLMLRHKEGPIEHELLDKLLLSLEASPAPILVSLAAAGSL